MRYYSQKINIIDLLQCQNSSEPSYFRISLSQGSTATNSTSGQQFFLLISVIYFKQYSLINQIFSNRRNSKIFSLPLNDRSNKFELVVYKCINEIEARGIDDSFIYELNTSLTDIKWAILQLERDFFTIIQHLPDINSVASKINVTLYSMVLAFVPTFNYFDSC